MTTLMMCIPFMAVQFDTYNYVPRPVFFSIRILCQIFGRLNMSSFSTLFITMTITYPTKV